MAETMTVGGITVPITGDPSDLNKKLNDVEKKSADSGKKAGDQFNAKIGAGFKNAGLAVAGVVVGIVAAIKKITDSMDQVGQRAQALGVTVEAMSRLQYAARQSGASVQDLDTAMISLSRRMGERGEMSEGVRIFSALGVSVTDASGKMKSADRVLADLADRFSRMEDGAGKTEIAVRLFGDSGARLLPMLNQGAAGLAEMGIQSDKLGNTLSEKATAQAREFNNAVDKIVVSVEAWARGVVSDLLPALTYLTEDLARQSQEVAQTEKEWSIFNSTLRILLMTGESIRAVFSALGSVVSGVVQSLLDLGHGEFRKAWKSVNDGLDEANEKLRQSKVTMAVIWEDWNTTVSKSGARTGGEFKKNMAPVIETSEEVAKRLNAVRLQNQWLFQDLMQSDTKSYGAKMTELMSMVQSGTIGFRDFTLAVRELKAEQGAAALHEIMSTDTTPFEQRIRELNRLVEEGSIKWEVYSDAVKSVTDSQKNAMNDLASTTASALTTIFENNKTAAIAAAIINTAQGVTKALSEYPPPYSFAMAALQGAAGLAQIAKIRSTTAQSSSASTGTATPSAGASFAAAPASAPAAPALNQTLTVQGINTSQLYSGAAMKELARKLIAYQQDGGKVVLV